MTLNLTLLMQRGIGEGPAQLGDNRKIFDSTTSMRGSWNPRPGRVLDARDRLFGVSALEIPSRP
jgi:hypothetical protein